MLRNAFLILFLGFACAAVITILSVGTYLLLVVIANWRDRRRNRRITQDERDERLGT